MGPSARFGTLAPVGFEENRALLNTCFRACLPAWTSDFLQDRQEDFSCDEAKMALAVELSRRNVLEGTGGPFGAAIFESHSRRLISVGVNVVVPTRLSIAHAEIMALSLAQTALDTHTLHVSAPDVSKVYELVTSCEPCAMCFGAIPWSGVSRVLCGATSEDATAIGFDEGPKVEDWPSALRARGIEVTQEILRAEARSVLDTYRERGGPIYGGQLLE